MPNRRLRLLYRDASTIDNKPVWSFDEGMVVQGVNSTGSVTTVSKIFVGDHVGQWEVFDNHHGPCIHNSDDFYCSVDMPLVRRLAGLLDKGVNDQLADRKFLRISVTCWCTNMLEWQPLCIQ